MPANRTHYNVNIGTYPRVLSFPYYIGLILIGVVIITALISIVFKTFAGIILLIPYIIISIILNKIYGGNNFYNFSSHKNRNILRTTNFITNIKYKSYGEKEKR